MSLWVSTSGREKVEFRSVHMLDPNAITVPLATEETPMEKVQRTQQDACVEDWQFLLPGQANTRENDAIRFLPGNDIRNYRIERALGWGGQGQVLLAVEQRTGEKVALKTLRSRWRDSDRVRRRFRREALALAPLQHENIVKVFHAFEESGMPFLVMEYVKGETLADAMRRKRYGHRRLLNVFLTCCDAMEYAHDLGIVHLDLKPQNILLTQEGVPKIADFGIARNLCRAPKRNVAEDEPRVAGSPAYMAPEQAQRNMQYIGPQTDVYALGVMLYQILTGDLPHLEETPRETIVHLLTMDPQPPIEIDPFIGWELNAICMRALARDPRQRYGGPRHMAADLRNYLACPPPAALTGD